MKPKNLKTYIHVSTEFNSDGQQGTKTTTFKAIDLQQLDQYIHDWQNADDEKIPKGRLKEKFVGPKNFYYAGGFSSSDVSFICKDTGEDMKDWYKKQGWGFYGAT